MQHIAEVFASSGPLATALDGYRERAGQLAMAEDLEQALQRREHLVAEAGTGVGKTFAYLVPVMRSGQRTIIATHTRSLQDQLYFGDIPRLRRALGQSLDLALLKGRSNYYCHQRADQAQAKNQSQAEELAGLRLWVGSHDSGDLDQYDGLPADWPLKSQVTSTADNCLGLECPFIDKCCVNKARQRAARAQVVVVNHHLLAADLALKDQGFGDLLARADNVIVDEAHKWPEVLGLFFGFTLSSYRLRDWYTDWQKLDPAWPELADPADAVLQALEQLQRSIPSRSERVGRDELLQDARFSQRLEELHQALGKLVVTAEEGADTPVRQQLLLRTLELQNQATDWQSAQDDQAVCWAQRSQRGFGLHALPLDVSALSRSGFAAQQGSWIFVSATLSVNGDFQYLRDRLGLDESTPCLRYPSPFDYPVQGRLYVPRALGQTGHGIDHTKAVLKQAWPLLQAADGGAFMLCTSLRAVQEAAELLRNHGPWRVLEQGSEANGLLLERFKRDGHAVLVGAASFWEGVDVPGDSLRLVIIDRLPFQSPADPVHAAQRRRVERLGQSAFTRVDLPPAAVALQQAVGRLLRRETDFGVVMIGDTRLVTKSYGRQLRASLPPLPLEQDVEPVRRFLQEQMAMRDNSAA